MRQSPRKNVFALCRKMDIDLVPGTESVKFDEELRQRLEVEVSSQHPEFTTDERDALIDTLIQANESVKKLVLAGMKPEMAKRIVESVLKDETASKSAEQVAQMLAEFEQS